MYGRCAGATPSVNSVSDTQKEAAVVMLAVQHRVQDYKAWKKVFDEHPPGEGGAKFHRVNRMIGDPNTIVVVAGFESAEQARAFGRSPGLADAMKRAGVVGEPRVEMYEEAEFIQYLP
jgi:uncharacterized protein (DUF1330 family)